MLPPYSGAKRKQSRNKLEAGGKQVRCIFYLILVSFFLDLFFCPKYGGNTLVRNVIKLPNYTAL
jgi:hypothetical protein